MEIEKQTNMTNTAHAFMAKKTQIEREHKEIETKTTILRYRVNQTLSEWKERHKEKMSAKKQWNDQMKQLFSKFEKSLSLIEKTDDYLHSNQMKLHDLLNQKQMISSQLKNKTKVFDISQIEELKRKELQLEKRIDERKERLNLLSNELKDVSAELLDIQLKFDSLNKPLQQMQNTKQNAVNQNVQKAEPKKRTQRKKK